MDESKNNFTVGHWNCRSIKNKRILLENFLKNNYFDVFCLNETKLSNLDVIDFFGYNFIRKDRNSRGGGVGILIKKGLDFEIIDSLSSFEFELIGLKVRLINRSINVFSWYLPPDNQKNKKNNQITDVFFNELNKHRPFVLAGDLNCHSKKWFCTKTTSKGADLALKIEQFDINVLNTEGATYRKEQDISKSVIDLILVSNDISDKFNFFKVYNENLTSDHFPIKANFCIESIKTKQKNCVKINRVIGHHLKPNLMN